MANLCTMCKMVRGYAHAWPANAGPLGHHLPGGVGVGPDKSDQSTHGGVQVLWPEVQDPSIPQFDGRVKFDLYLANDAVH